IRVPIFLPRHRVNGHFAQIGSLRIHEIVERLRRRFLVERVVVDRLPHHCEVRLQRRFFRPLHRLVVAGRGDTNQNKNDRNDDHQLDQRKSPLARRSSSCQRFRHASPSPITTNSPNLKISPSAAPLHHSEYFVPSLADPCDFECTSNTFFPPQLVESGSS